jgi:hypothetical protein
MLLHDQAIDKPTLQLARAGPEFRGKQGHIWSAAPSV